MLPLEAIELDDFRQRHGHDRFWCGLLLGGCGLQLTTKLYTDRVCRFAHHPGPDGHPHLFGRRARGVASADHLYVKAAADAWLKSHGIDLSEAAFAVMSHRVVAAVPVDPQNGAVSDLDRADLKRVGPTRAVETVEVGVLIDCHHDAPALFIAFPVVEGVAELLGVIQREVEPPSHVTAVSQDQVSSELKMGGLRVASPVGDVGKAVG
ncbi:hypothetical protein ACFTUC_06170 [Streptomyces sp. NPDC056944]|uniref:hypothetical protein n=1 Tax=Streptomyces sp. NPDC056944 TaxID=3345972 RepID=UPI00362FAD0F